MLRPLVIDQATRDEFTRVREFSDLHRIRTGTLLRMMSGSEPPPGDDPNRVVELPQGWRIVYTVEEQPRGWMRHLSVSTDGRHEGKAPNPFAVALICRELGFSIGEDLLFTDRQTVSPDPVLGWIAPNVLELL